ncbi:Hypothetical protein PACV_156 [Pacmanvirus A23]|uniref:Hypothetical protein n=1 Tax=Pacmanvirus A23 TaxID=1932881 RepID=UPI000A094EC9|nr:Hypothetical protein B9W72_gp154 [Pacmanvirus A23]SIP85871.1 Hypothetical protein PACV_156 [Pacmanvirus A23]
MEPPLILGNTIPDIGLIGMADFGRFAHFEWYGSFNLDAIITRLNGVLPDFIDYCEDSFIDAIMLFLGTVKNHSAAEAVWFTIRFSKPTREFDTPRWHRDGRMFTEGATKYICTLLGPQTLLLGETPTVTAHCSKRNYEANREILAQVLQHEPKIELEPRQMFRITCGKPNSPVHSEPKVDTLRIFISAVPGTKQQIKEMVHLREIADGFCDC